ncbi:hypothetical protein J3A83DRAFT_2687682 [Scleroderma citrinum]
MNYALKHPALFRPASRPTSPAPPKLDTANSVDRGRPINKLSFGGFRWTSSVAAITPSSPAPAPAPLVHDGSYLEALNLKLSEAVSKALVQPSGPAIPGELVGGKRPIPAGRGHALGLVIASELKATRDNTHLYKAALRSLHKPLSVLLSNLSAMLLPLLSSTAFLQPPTPTVQVLNPNPTQLHVLAVADFAGELLKDFDELGLGLDKDARGDNLKPIREGLVSLIARVINPLINGIKSNLLPLIEALECPVTVTVHKTGAKTGPVLHPSITVLQTLMPIYAKALARYTVSLPSQAALAMFLISLLWRALVALSYRPYVLPSPPVSPPGSPRMLPSLLKKQPTLSGGTGPVTPPSGRFVLKLPPSRPPSPPTTSAAPRAATDAKVLYELMLSLPRPPPQDEATKIAREAVDEAFEDLRILASLLEAADNPSFGMNKTLEEVFTEVDALTGELPVLIALPVLLRGQFSGERPSVARTTVASIVNIAEEEYRKGCLSGFGPADEYGNVIGLKVLDPLRNQQDNGLGDKLLMKWLEAHVESTTH